VIVAGAARAAALFYAKKRRRARAAKIISHGAMRVEEGADTGTVVGSLSMVPQFGRTTYTLTDDAGGRFELIGSLITVADGGLLVFADDESHTIEVSARDPQRNSFVATMTISVTEAP